ncbi:MAG: peptidyl-prolyl cis-trans isomerase, partial [Lachnospiraceae bacterium]|nr:peptidyl-prolyl cis-trans isomerase [Lachnospiraceae bacterium]
MRALPTPRCSWKKSTDVSSIATGGRLKNGESFQSLARQYSTDDLAQKGGDAGWVSRAQLPDEITQIVFSL